MDDFDENLSEASTNVIPFINDLKKVIAATQNRPPSILGCKINILLQGIATGLARWTRVVWSLSLGKILVVYSVCGVSVNLFSLS